VVVFVSPDAPPEESGGCLRVAEFAHWSGAERFSDEEFTAAQVILDMLIDNRGELLAAARRIEEERKCQGG